MKTEDFDKYFIEIFMTYSLKYLTAYSNPNIPNPKHPLLLGDLKKRHNDYGWILSLCANNWKITHDSSKMHISQNNEPTNTSIENNKQTRTPTKKQRKSTKKTLEKIQQLENQSKGQKPGRIPLKDKKRRKKTKTN